MPLFYFIYLMKKNVIDTIFDKMTLNLVLLSIQPIAKILRRKKLEKKNWIYANQNPKYIYFFFFLIFFSLNFSMPKNNVAGNSGMPLSANL